MLKDVEYPKHVWKGICPLKANHPLKDNIRIFGGDTETVRGNPHTVQIAGPDDSTIIFVNKDTIFTEFWGWIRSRLRHNGVNICYFHNLNFDLRVIFSLRHVEMYEQFSDIHLTYGVDEKGIPLGQYPVEVRMLFGKVNSATITEGSMVLRLYDSRAFTMTSLAKSLKMYGIKRPKLPIPDGLGQEHLTSQEFKEYALNDALVERALGIRIIEFHKEFDITPSITLPAFSAKVFRRRFLRLTETIPFPPYNIVKAAELSYHGGKNGKYIVEPIALEDVYEVDISSAYSYAMAMLPPLTRGEYVEIKGFSPGKAGIYCLSGKTGNHLYPLIYDHAFKPLGRNVKFQNLWHTSYEVERILKKKSGVEISRIFGFVWEPSKGAQQPFEDYVRYFYRKKEEAVKGSPEYYFYKFMLNQVYGKLASTTPVKTMEAIKEIKALQNMGVPIPDSFTITDRFDPVKQTYVRVASCWKAGSMYNPFWASLVTGYIRAYLYDLEIKLDALHSATDSVKSMQPHPYKKGLGGLNVECFGRCYLLRNKLYLHCSHDSTYCGHKEPKYFYPKDEKEYIRRDAKGRRFTHPAIKHRGKPLIDDDGQHLCKVAMHGFKGPIWELWYNRHRLIADGSLEYHHKHVVGLREGLRRGQTPCDFIDVTEVLKLDQSTSVVRAASPGSSS